MSDYLYSSFIEDKRISIRGIPAILLRQRDSEAKLATVIFYHGWSSNKESQRIRGLILAAMGFQVLIPDAIYHGERDSINHNTAAGQYFWEVIFKSMEEADFLIDEIVDKYDGDPNNISIMGHSMGGFTVAGIFAHNQRLKAAVALNGAFAWHHANEILKAQMEILMTEELRSVEGKLMGMDPMKHLASLIDRPILMLNGASDTVVSPESQKLFFKEIRPLYGDKGRIKLIEYPNLGHFVTTNMMEDSIRWLKEHLG